MSNITIILLTKNEQENLTKWHGWLGKLKNINEVIAIDDGSTDDTKKILKSLESKEISVKIFDRRIDSDFAGQRNYAVKQATNDWILFIDADEVPSPKLVDHLNSFILDENYCYSINRYLVYSNYVLYHGISSTDHPIRLFNKNFGTFIGSVHEVWTTNKKVINIKQPLFHYSIPSLKIFLQKINTYSTIRAQELFEAKKPVWLIDLMLYPKGKFIQYYFWHLGFVDGLPGLITCLALSFYSFLVRAKLWRLYHA